MLGRDSSRGAALRGVRVTFGPENGRGKLVVDDHIEVWEPSAVASTLRHDVSSSHTDPLGKETTEPLTNFTLDDVAVMSLDLVCTRILSGSIEGIKDGLPRCEELLPT